MLGQSTMTGDALTHTASVLRRGTRQGASQVVIVLTDGKSQDEVKEAASALIGDKGNNSNSVRAV